MAPRLVIAANSPTFDEDILSRWRDEGFDVQFEPVTDDSRSSLQRFEEIGDELEEGETYAIVCYAHAATALLKHAFHEPLTKLTTLVAYYPTTLPDPSLTPRKGLRVQVHLAGSQPFAPKFHYYTYQGTNPGFDESKSEAYDKFASGIAWSRSLDKVRRGFGVEVDLESVWEDHMALEFIHHDPTAVMATMTPQPYVNHIPTLTGGVGSANVLRFYSDFFIPTNPASFLPRLLSRTVGSDTIVDEMFISFTHTCEILAMLPGVPPTGKYVEMIAVGIIKFRGGKVHSEHLHWDQASVLVQLGLLDPVEGGKASGVERLPVVGAEAARKVLDVEGVRGNELLKGWY